MMMRAHGPRRHQRLIEIGGAVIALLALAVSCARAQDVRDGQNGRGGQRGMHRMAIAARAVPRGTVLTADDIEYRDTTLMNGGMGGGSAVVDSSAVRPGWVARRVITVGEPLRPPAVQPPIAVSANQPVAVEWQDGSLRLTVHGIATRDASVGERITVRMDGGRRLEGVVVGPGHLKLN